MTAENSTAYSYGATAAAATYEITAPPLLPRHVDVFVCERATPGSKPRGTLTATLRRIAKGPGPWLAVDCGSGMASFWFTQDEMYLLASLLYHAA